MENPTILLLAGSAAYRNLPAASTASPAALAPAVKGDDSSGVRLPPEETVKPLIWALAPGTGDITYTKFGVCARTIDAGLAADVNGDPGTGVRVPAVGSTVKLEIVPDPLFRTSRIPPLKAVSTTVGLVPTATGVPETVSHPVFGSMAKILTSFAPEAVM